MYAYIQYNPYYITGYSNDLANKNTTATIQMENQLYSESKNEVCQVFRETFYDSAITVIYPS